MTKEERKQNIAAAAAARKGSKQEKLEQATAPGVVKPSKKEATKIPSAMNLVKPKAPPVVTQGDRVDDTSTTTEGDIRDREKNVPSRKPAPKTAQVEAPTEAADKELDAQVTSAAKAKKEKPAKDPNQLSVSDIARECNVDPKRARARLRAAGKTAADGRWPLVARDSQEHKDIAALIAADAPKADPKPDVAG